MAKACSHCRKGHHRTCSGKAAVLTYPAGPGSAYRAPDTHYVTCSCSAAGHRRTKIPPK